MGGPDGDANRVAKDILSRPAEGAALKFPFIYPDQSLSLALEKMGSGGVDTLPVVSRADIRQFLGVLTLPDILNAYGLMALLGAGSPERCRLRRSPTFPRPTLAIIVLVVMARAVWRRQVSRRAGRH